MYQELYNEIMTAIRPKTFPFGVKFQDLSVAVPCFGDRKTGLAQDDKLTVAFPVSLIPKILEGLRGTAKTAAYPTPFDIGFPQMPDYTLTGWAVDYRKARKGKS